MQVGVLCKRLAVLILLWFISRITKKMVEIGHVWEVNLNRKDELVSPCGNPSFSTQPFLKEFILGKKLAVTLCRYI